MRILGFWALYLIVLGILLLTKVFGMKPDIYSSMIIAMGVALAWLIETKE